MFGHLQRHIRLCVGCYHWTHPPHQAIAEENYGGLYWCLLQYTHLWCVVGHIFHAIRLHDLSCPRPRYQRLEFSEMSTQSSLCVEGLGDSRTLECGLVNGELSLRLKTMDRYLLLKYRLVSLNP